MTAEANISQRIYGFTAMGETSKKAVIDPNELSRRASRVLRQLTADGTLPLSAVTQLGVLASRGIGRKTLKEIVEFAARRGYVLRRK